MNNNTDFPSTDTDPIAILTDLGLKQYEAQCFIALARMPSGTAKTISEVAAIPRTRVYDAANQLQTRGLVDVQHSNPQQFRAVSTDEAITILRRQFNQQFESLETSLTELDPVEGTRSDEGNVWTTTGQTAITERAIQFIDSAEDEIILVLDGIGEESVSDRLVERLRAAATEREVTVHIGTLTATTHEQVVRSIPEAHTFESGLEWLQPQTEAEVERIGRLLLTDRNSLLLSSIESTNGREETAIWSADVESGLLILARRLLAAGLDRETEEHFGSDQNE